MKCKEKDIRKKEDEATEMESPDSVLTDLKAENIIYGLLDAILVNWGKTE